ncbi:hypothetical protein CCHR01_15629 [Colletotrichum chrysophilum]|uniref:Uncharacterized protein n=1 Tax=Colletotrichum chrysophilum TaxID=1836956 RepID=A0AAD9AA64_9PEZI|nr:hypothetical protein CCHR01_15629 [Colletotrichum chrysophilum]
MLNGGDLDWGSVLFVSGSGAECNGYALPLYLLETSKTCTEGLDAGNVGRRVGRFLGWACYALVGCYGPPPGRMGWLNRCSNAVCCRSV